MTTELSYYVQYVLHVLSLHSLLTLPEQTNTLRLNYGQKSAYTADYHRLAQPWVSNSSDVMNW